MPSWQWCTLAVYARWLRKTWIEKNEDVRIDWVRVESTKCEKYIARNSLRLTRYARANIINDGIIKIQPIINQVEVLIIALQYGLFGEKFTINIHQFHVLLYYSNYSPHDFLFTKEHFRHIVTVLIQRNWMCFFSGLIKFQYKAFIFDIDTSDSLFLSFFLICSVYRSITNLIMW